MPNPRSLHFDVQVISRGQGKSSVASASYRSGKKLQAGAPTRSALAAASYRSGESLYDEQEHKTFDYTRKEDIRHSEIIAPADAPVWTQNRQALWNTVEKTEKRKDAQLARDVIAVFPRELNLEQCKSMIREYVNDNFVSKGMIADLSIHEADASDGGKNPHAHIMLTMRDVGPDGFGKKNRDWNNLKLVTSWRDSWEKSSNHYLEQAGHDVRVTLKSYENLGIDKTPGVHMGAEQWNLEQKRVETGKGNKNRKVDHENALKDILHSRELPEDFMALPEEESVPEQEISQQRANGPVTGDPPQTHSAESERKASNRIEAEAIELKDWGSEQSGSSDTSADGARESHEALLRQQLQAKEAQGALGRASLSLAVKDYAKRITQSARDIGRRAFEQVRNLLKETERLKEEEKGHER